MPTRNQREFQAAVKKVITGKARTITYEQWKANPWPFGGIDVYSELDAHWIVNLDAPLDPGYLYIDDEGRAFMEFGDDVQCNSMDDLDAETRDALREWAMDNLYDDEGDE